MQILQIEDLWYIEWRRLQRILNNENMEEIKNGIKNWRSNWEIAES